MTEQTRNRSNKDLSLAFFGETTINVNGYIKRKGDGSEVRSRNGNLLMRGTISIGDNTIDVNLWANTDTGLVTAKAVTKTLVVDGNEEPYSPQKVRELMEQNARFYVNAEEIPNVPPVGFFQVPAGVSSDDRLFVTGSVSAKVGDAPQRITVTLSSGNTVPKAGSIVSGNAEDVENTYKAFAPVIERCKADPEQFKQSLRNNNSNNGQAKQNAPANQNAQAGQNGQESQAAAQDKPSPQASAEPQAQASDPVGAAKDDEFKDLLI